jgi:monothiol glutaredoxin
MILSFFIDQIRCRPFFLCHFLHQAAYFETILDLSMLSKVLRSSLSLKVRPSLSFNVLSRHLCDTHDDFKPKKAAGPEGMEEAVAMIEKQVKEHDIMLYMKGTPSQPQCGFSMQAVRILNATGVDFSSVNVLEYGAIREGVKQYSQWPTIPQLYVKGEFVGGCDIMTTMFQEGELESLMKEHNLLEE